MDMQKLCAIIRETDRIFFDDALRADVHQKGDADFVTRADIGISDYLHARLQEEFPAIGFISEEGDTAADPDSDYWILDPIDGTTNFMYGMPLCAVSLALYEHGCVTAGVIYAPYTQELFWAQKGEGAYLNSTRIFCSRCSTLTRCVSAFELNPYYKDDYRAALVHTEKLYRRCQDVRVFGCASLSMAYVACGRADAFLGRYLKPWDYAAGIILVQESGGTVTDLCGGLCATVPRQHIVAAGTAIYPSYLALLQDENTAF